MAAVSDYVYYVSTSSLSIVATILNIFIFVAFIRDEKIRESSTNIYLFSLCVCDILVAVVNIPSYILARLYEDINAGIIHGFQQNTNVGGNGTIHLESVKADCTFQLFVTATLCVATMIHLLAISVDRYVKVKFDVYNVRTTIDRKKIVRNLFLIWAPGLLSASLILLAGDSSFSHGCQRLNFDSYGMTVTLTVIVIFMNIPGLIAVYLNCHVYKIAIETKRNLESRNSPDLSAMHDEHNLLYLQEHGNDKKLTVRTIAEQMTITLKQNKIALIILGINVSYLFTWPLDSIIWAAAAINEDYCKVSWCAWALDVNPWLGFANSLINPLIVLIMHVEYRNAVLKHVFSSKPDQHNSFSYPAYV